MKLAKYLSIAALLVVPFTAQLNAQVLQGNVAGAASLWIEAGQGAAANGNCAWTSKTKGVTYTLDSRVPSPYNQENGNLWVSWSPGTGGSCAAPTANSAVYTYISLDAVTGTRCLFAQPQCTINTTASAGASGANLLPGVTDTPLPAAVLSAFNGTSISIAATDLLPADAAFSIYSVLALCGPLSSGTQFVGLGYGPATSGYGTTINSFYSSGSFHTVNFGVYGNDPITGSPIPSYTITPVGAAPILVFVNTLDANGFGSSAVQNITRAELGLIFGGIFVRTADVLPQAFAGTGASYAGITALIREPLAGIYNTFDHSIPNNKEIYRSQESGNCPTNGAYGVSTNPLNLSRTVGTTTGYRNRVIGSTEMISEAQLVQDSIGYAYWSSGNFNNVSNIKYLTVDGVDPLFSTYTNGTIPQTGNGLLPNVTLQHVADGGYPIWSEERFISYSAGATAAANLSAFAQNLVSFGAGATQPDFVTSPNLTVFHAHYAPVFTNFNATNTASNGTRVCGAGSNPEDGADSGGLVFSQQAGGDFCVLKGNYGAAGGVGPTNTASFGVRQ
ncbi:MAG: hypothetical protein ABSB14_07815 [Candidatus Sulfotelmatobacter sp.]|jgi:hypothetical protein